ncbi:MAG TPA: hypothetical protein VMU99_00300 [Acidimicrobiales bacterium]|nr:hypothetical protein [Acidimicrobiales bacterium]
MADRNGEVGEPDLVTRELLEIVKMRNLEIANFGDEVDEIHRTKDRRITELDVALWHERRRADDLDRRWNGLAREYESIKADLDRTGAELVRVQSQRSYRLLVKTVAFFKGQTLRRSIRQMSSPPKSTS